VLDTEELTPAEAAERVLRLLEDAGITPPA
jgi:hypothetical protein